MISPSALAVESPKGSLLAYQAISSHLLQLGYPQKSIDSMNRCGELITYTKKVRGDLLTFDSKIMKSCGCGNTIFNSLHRCNLRTCPNCAKRRKGRVTHKYLNFFKNLPMTQTCFTYFLTISPRNYSNLKFGLKDIRKSFNKFLRHDYIKERMKAGLYVIETKGCEGNWNIHIHALVYGRWIDNKIRGYCKDCHQNFLNYDSFSKKYYCGNSKCNSSNVTYTEDSKIVRLWKQSSKSDEVHMYIKRQKDRYTHKDSPKLTLAYLCKYVSANKDDFASPRDIAIYIYSTHKCRLISAFGSLYKYKFPKLPYLCVKCGGEVHFCNDVSIISIMEKRLIESKPIPLSVQKQLSAVYYMASCTDYNKNI